MVKEPINQVGVLQKNRRVGVVVAVVVSQATTQTVGQGGSVKAGTV